MGQARRCQLDGTGWKSYKHVVSRLMVALRYPQFTTSGVLLLVACGALSQFEARSRNRTTPHNPRRSKAFRPVLTWMCEMYPRFLPSFCAHNGPVLPAGHEVDQLVHMLRGC